MGTAAHTTLAASAIARVCHEANAAYCLALGDTSQKHWDEAPEWQRASAVAGVEFLLANPNAGPADSHKSWLKDKIANGWTLAPVKDATAKTHPCMVEYNDLPLEQRFKDALFVRIVRTLRRDEGGAQNATKAR